MFYLESVLRNGSDGLQLAQKIRRIRKQQLDLSLSKLTTRDITCVGHGPVHPQQLIMGVDALIIPRFIVMKTLFSKIALFDVYDKCPGPNMDSELRVVMNIVVVEVDLLMAEAN